MVTMPAEGRWTIQTLGEFDVEEALVFLRHDPLVNVYLIARLLEAPALALAQIGIVRHDGAIVFIAARATNTVLATDESLPRSVTDTAIALVADRIITRMLPVRAISSPVGLVETLWGHH